MWRSKDYIRYDASHPLRHALYFSTSISCPFPCASVQASNWQKISKLIVYFCVVRSFEKEDFLQNSRILSCLVQLKDILFNLLCVFDSWRASVHTPTLYAKLFTDQKEVTEVCQILWLAQPAGGCHGDADHASAENYFSCQTHSQTPTACLDHPVWQLWNFRLHLLYPWLFFWCVCMLSAWGLSSCIRGFYFV